MDHNLSENNILYTRPSIEINKKLTNEWSPKTRKCHFHQTKEIIRKRERENENRKM